MGEVNTTILTDRLPTSELVNDSYAIELHNNNPTRMVNSHDREIILEAALIDGSSLDQTLSNKIDQWIAEVCDRERMLDNQMTENAKQLKYLTATEHEYVGWILANYVEKWEKSRPKGSLRNPSSC